MSELDDLLQKKLEAIERRASPRKTPKSLGDESAELDALIQLAATLRSMPHPRLEAETSQAMQQRLLETAKLTIRPQNRVSPFNLSWLLKPGLAGITLVFITVLVLVFGGVWLSGPSVARTATLRETTGQVQVADRDGADWKDVTAGTVLSVGQHLRTLDGSSATLQFFDGTHTTLAANTSLILSEMSGGWRTELQVGLTQQYGLTSHQVVSLVGKKSHFIVHTLAGSANVRGTSFSIAVDPNGQAYFVVESGQVLVENEKGDVTLDPGQATAVLIDQAPEPPAYSFTLTDTLVLADDDTWWIGGLPFVITRNTLLLDEFQPGASVVVTGRILGDGQWVVDSIQPANVSSKKYRFAGVVQEMGDEVWSVNGISIQVNLATRLLDPIQVGDVVKVNYVILGNGSWQAVEIATLVAGKILEPTATVTGLPLPSGDLTPEELHSSQSIPAENCSSSKPQPEAVTLSDRFNVKVEEIMGWFCQGLGFGEIDLAYSLSYETGIPVADVFAMRAEGLGWGEIKQSLSAQPVNENKPPTKTPAPAKENKPEKEVKPSKTPKP